MPTTEHACWWLVARCDGETTLIFGSDRGESEARQKGLELLPGIDFEVKKLPTRNLSRASSLLKGTRLEEHHSLQEAKKRLHHKPNYIKDRRMKHHVSNR